MCASFCPRYEDEINKRNAAENEFVGLKKVSKWGGTDQGSISGHHPHGVRAEPAALGHSDPMLGVGFIFFLTVLETKEAALNTLLVRKDALQCHCD